jgi:hypothetical protein
MFDVYLQVKWIMVVIIPLQCKHRLSYSFLSLGFHSLHLMCHLSFWGIWCGWIKSWSYTVTLIASCHKCNSVTYQHEPCTDFGLVFIVHVSAERHKNTQLSSVLYVPIHTNLLQIKDFQSEVHTFAVMQCSCFFLIGWIFVARISIEQKGITFEGFDFYTSWAVTEIIKYCLPLDEHM